MMEHRLGKRSFVSVPVQIRFEFGRTARGVLRNISSSGMYVETLARPAAYTCLEVGMETPCSIEPTPVWIPMFVVRCPADGVGLMRYKDIDVAADAAVERLLRCGLFIRTGGAVG